jgi:uncharacterized protein DUF4166/saccharopine dehydrogenase-like protein
VRRARRRILIVGGYGTFGGRLAMLLADEPRATLIIAGRSRDKAAAFCARLPAGADKIAATVDRDGDLDRQLRALAPDLVVDATGPFQAYGDDPYRLVEACLALGIDYLDLADGAAFVTGIGRFDAAARARDIFILSGVSSFPVLTAAVVRALSQDLVRGDAITAGIAPLPYAAVGLNVIRAIACYAGKPVPLIRDGRPAVGYALTETMRYTIAPPGYLPLRSLRFSLVDVPDLQVLPALWPQLRAIWAGAGPVPDILHRLLNGLAWLVRLRLLPSLSPFARFFHAVAGVVRWGENRGGMFVAIAGAGHDGKPVERSWHLLAEGEDGPFIPSMAIAAIVRRGLDGRWPEAGARPATGELELGDYAPIFARRAIVMGRRDEPSDSAAMPLYQRLLGEAWTRLPAALRALHGFTGATRAEGVATVERGTSVLSRLLGALFGFPPAGENVPVRVSFTARGQAEIWRRDFAGKAFSSVQSEGRGRWARLLAERFGPFTVGLALVLDGGTLRLIVRRWSVLGLPLPLAVAPGGDFHESAADGRFHFHVAIRHPFTGLIVRYRGWLMVQR